MSVSPAGPDAPEGGREVVAVGPNPLLRPPIDAGGKEADRTGKGPRVAEQGGRAGPER